MRMSDYRTEKGGGLWLNGLCTGSLWRPGSSLEGTHQNVEQEAQTRNSRCPQARAASLSLMTLTLEVYFLCI